MIFSNPASDHGLDLKPKQFGFTLELCVLSVVDLLLLAWKILNLFVKGCENLLTFDLLLSVNKKAQLSLTNPRDACEKFARFT